LIRSERAKSGYKGVKPNKSRWEARINDNGLIVTLGTFDSKEEAAAIFARAEYYLSKGGESPKKVKEVANGEEQVPDEEIVRVEV
jgi:acetylornithine deacetylase/succinyl-diaminopimelate desuccinylase-like protein